eukprot:TRINITY_DN2885_c1_g1::TRINITY_DN2885_c1_g1_i6::g.5411::m.5411 TRINITY_DN2885_c1_g1::TRINITY_DN2885_c1_g1_i6::g.5411  ORF type:complete len:479 (-),score=99.87,sp/Q74FW6/TSAL_GEOSL/40.31/1e-70,PALP/PF00291.20/7.3e-76 TRINITY_DN2885_c1_g1_i6:516-1952(-)
MTNPFHISDEDLKAAFAMILDAEKVTSRYAKETPLDQSQSFSQMCNCNVFLKMENLQKTGSFKVRGALNALSLLPEEAREKGVIAVSAGNHAQGVAFAATSMNIKSVICMPATAPAAKVRATKSYGAQVQLCGLTFDSTFEKAQQLQRETGAIFVHPFDDANVIAGQGTIGLEIARQMVACGGAADTVIIPVGGGGIAGGIATALRQLSPKTKVYGVQAEGCPSMPHSLSVGVPTKLPRPPSTICDGIAVGRPGERTFALAHTLLAGVALVDDLAVSRAAFFLLERAKTVVEPAGCVALAALIAGKIPVEDVKGKRVVCVLSGGNVDMSMLHRIIGQQLFSLQRQIHIRGMMPDQTMCIRNLFSVLSDTQGVKVVDTRLDRSIPYIPPTHVKIHLILDVPDELILPRLLHELQNDSIGLVIDSHNLSLPAASGSSSQPSSLTPESDNEAGECQSVEPFSPKLACSSLGPFAPVPANRD